ncbi:MAG: hypothetical protein IPO27_02890 [Bacteroidetes bacterium]|nr:hypothetical protein [Bacteroidota bacterium]
MKLKLVSMAVLCLMATAACKKENVEPLKSEVFALDRPAKVKFELDGSTYFMEGNNVPVLYGDLNKGSQSYGSRFDIINSCTMTNEIGKDFFLEIEKGDLLVRKITDETSWYNYLLSAEDNNISSWMNEGVQLTLQNEHDSEIFRSLDSDKFTFKILEYTINDQDQLIVHALFEADLLGNNGKVHQLRNGEMVGVFWDFE